MTYPYFPGCSLQGMASEYDQSARGVCQRLGVTLQEAPNWVCCGATPAHATHHLLSIALPAKSLAEVWKDQQGSSAPSPTLVAACAACYSRLRTANYEMRHDSDLCRQVQQVAEIDYAGQVEVRHLLDVLRHDVGLEAIRERVTRPLEGLKVACYYGCLLVRPPKVVAFDDPENPQIMDELLTAAGATCVDWPYRTECCGGNFSLSRPDVVRKLVNDLLREAQEAGAEAIAVACPLCQNNLDLRQADAAKAYGRDYHLPVLYFTQLLGWALGLEARELGLERLIVSPQALLQRFAARPATPAAAS